MMFLQNAYREHDWIGTISTSIHDSNSCRARRWTRIRNLRERTRNLLFEQLYIPHQERFQILSSKIRTTSPRTIENSNKDSGNFISHWDRTPQAIATAGTAHQDCGENASTVRPVYITDQESEIISCVKLLIGLYIRSWQSLFKNICYCSDK